MPFFLNLKKRSSKNTLLDDSAAAFQSRFGGFWTDRLDALEILSKREKKGLYSKEEAAQIRLWIKNGFLIIPGAVSTGIADRVLSDIEKIFDGKIPGGLMEAGPQIIPALPEHREQRLKGLDIYTVSAAAREAIFAPKIGEFLARIFEKPPMVFQSLQFQGGQEQPHHRDSAYVKVEPLMRFAAAWIALEDIRPGSGELEYFPGSHRVEDYLFPGGSQWHTHGQEHEDFYRHLREGVAASGLKAEKFRGKKGDALLWHADLVHGGGKIEDHSFTRRSLVAHYCPFDSEPLYYRHPPHGRCLRVGEKTYLSFSGHGHGHLVESKLNGLKSFLK